MRNSGWLLRAALWGLLVAGAAPLTWAQEVAKNDSAPFGEEPAVVESSDDNGLEPIWIETQAQTAARQRIEAMLEKPISIDFVETPLVEVLHFVEDAAGLPLQISHQNLEDAGIGGDTPISFSARDISVRSALRLMFRDLQLTTVIVDEILLVTTPDHAESELVTVIYPVNDLVSQGSEESLIATIKKNVGPTTWDEVGGAASIKPFRGAIVVLQTTAAHTELQSLLRGLRQLPKR